MVKNKSIIRGNNRSNGIVNRHLNATPANDWEAFEDKITVKHANKTGKVNSNSRFWDKEFELRIEELYRNDVYEPIFDMLCPMSIDRSNQGVLEKLAAKYAKEMKLDWCELFSDFQFHLMGMLGYQTGTTTTMNPDMSFMENLCNQLKCRAINKFHYYQAEKRKDDQNTIKAEQWDKIEDSSKEHQYDNIEVVIAIQQLDIDELDKKVLIGIATGQIDKQEIPGILGWDLTANNKMKLSRYCKRLQKILA